MQWPIFGQIQYPTLEVPQGRDLTISKWDFVTHHRYWFCSWDLATCSTDCGTLVRFVLHFKILQSNPYKKIWTRDRGTDRSHPNSLHFPSFKRMVSNEKPSTLIFLDNILGSHSMTLCIGNPRLPNQSEWMMHWYQQNYFHVEHILGGCASMMEREYKGRSMIDWML